MDYSFTITARDFNGKPRDAKYPDDAPHTSSGQCYDLLAVAAGYQEFNDLDPFASDPSIEYVLNEYDYEAAYIAALNAADKAGDQDKLAVLLGLDGPEDVRLVIEGTKLLAGAYVALHEPKVFDDGLKAWTEKVKDAAWQYWDEPEDVPADLIKELQEAADDANKEQMREFLHGDENWRNWRGVYNEARRTLYRDIDSLEFSQSDDDRKKNRLAVSVDELDGRRIVADWEGCDLGKRRIGVDRVKHAIVRNIVNSAASACDERRKKNEKRAAEYKEQQARREASAKKEEAERRAKLETMTR